MRLENPTKIKVLAGWIPGKSLLPVLQMAIFSLCPHMVKREHLPLPIYKTTHPPNRRTLHAGSQFSSVAQSCLTLCDHMNCSTPGLPVYHQFPEFTHTHVHWVMPSNHLILCHPLLLLPSIFPNIRAFSNESAFHIRWPKYWNFSFNISPSNEYPGLISFRMDWLDVLAVQGTLKSLLQHHSSKASILQRSAFFIVPTLTSIHDHWKNHSLD